MLTLREQLIERLLKLPQERLKPVAGSTGPSICRRISAVLAGLTTSKCNGIVQTTRYGA